MSGSIEYLPGSRAMLVYEDEHGASHTSIVEIVNRRLIQNESMYVVRARPCVTNHLFLQMDVKPNSDEDWIIGAVEASRLLPVGQRNFTIVD